MPHLREEREDEIPQTPEVSVVGAWLCINCGEDISERVRNGGWPGRDRETVVVIDNGENGETYSNGENCSEYLRTGELCAYEQFCTSECQACSDRATLEYIASERHQADERIADPDLARYARRTEMRDELK